MKIQSSFRGHQARKEVETIKEKKESESAKSSSEQQGDQEEEEIDIDLEDPEVGKAAVKIQSSFRGHQARKEVETIKEKKESESAKSSSEQQGDQEEEQIDIDLEDPEVGKASSENTVKL